jgi:hypothetical protein
MGQKPGQPARPLELALSQILDAHLKMLAVSIHRKGVAVNPKVQGCPPMMSTTSGVSICCMDSWRSITSDEPHFMPSFPESIPQPVPPGARA